MWGIRSTSTPSSFSQTPEQHNMRRVGRKEAEHCIVELLVSMRRNLPYRNEIYVAVLLDGCQLHKSAAFKPLRKWYIVYCLQLSLESVTSCQSFAKLSRPLSSLNGRNSHTRLCVGHHWNLSLESWVKHHWPLMGLSLQNLQTSTASVFICNWLNLQLWMNGSDATSIRRWPSSGALSLWNIIFG